MIRMILMNSIVVAFLVYLGTQGSLDILAHDPTFFTPAMAAFTALLVAASWCRRPAWIEELTVWVTGLQVLGLVGTIAGITLAGEAITAEKVADVSAVSGVFQAYIGTAVLALLPSLIGFGGAFLLSYNLRFTPLRAR